MSAAADPVHVATCLCGAVRIEVTGDLAPPDACHCTRCRKSSGHVFVSTDVPKERVTITGAEHLTWYAPRDEVRRGFCSTCGSQLLWDPVHHDWIGVAMGAFDTPTRTRVAKHIFVADKGDYYEITDGLPQELRPPNA